MHCLKLNMLKTVVASCGAAPIFLHSYGNRSLFLHIRPNYPWQFFGNRLTGFDSVRVEFCHFPISRQLCRR